MTRCSLIALLAMAASTPVALAQRPVPSRQGDLERALAHPHEDYVRAHVAFLADDALEGRAPATRGGEMAARYIAAQFQAAGLAPGAPDGSYFHPVSLVGAAPSPSMVIGIGRRTISFEVGDELVAWPTSPDSAVTVDADIVFVGYGIQAAEWGWDDYKNQSVAGKILLMLVNDPGLTDASRFQGSAMTYYGRWTYKLEQAARMGAAGVILIHTDQSATYGWNVVRSSWTGEQIMLDRPTANTLRFASWITELAARRLAEETGRDFAALRRRAQQRDFRPVPLGAHAVVHIRSRIRRFEGRNVVARLVGADSVARNEAIVYTAHYDHLGVGQPVNGDSIYNGAEDNASGVATMLAAGAAFARGGLRPRRSLVFIATTAEEAGLLGAESYVQNPIVPLERTVAVVNIDRVNMRGVSLDAVALGAARSELGPYFEAAARDEGLSVSADPNPGTGSFFRSDHFPFARAGVPVLSLRIPSRFANRPDGWAAEEEAEYLSERYHQPSDEFDPAFDFAGALQQARILIRLGWALGQTDRFPTWYPDSEFRMAGERLRLRRER